MKRLLEFFNLKKNQSTQDDFSHQRTLKTIDFRAAGVCYYINSIQKLAFSNPNYKKKANSTDNGRIYRYNYINKPVKLIPEPQNPHDPNAVMVIIAGELVGYVPADLCLQIKRILSDFEIKYISSFISGGQYKEVSCGKVISRDEKDIYVNIKIGYV